MHALRFIAGLLLIVLTLMDGFETILLPRRINHRFRFSRFYYRSLWLGWKRACGAMPVGKWREAMLSVFGPLSLLGLFGSWMASLVLGFALLQWSLAAQPSGPNAADRGGFLDCLYFSGTTCFTLGLGDLVPPPGASRGFTVAEGGLGFGFLAIIIGYLPVLYQAFSRREVTISLLDARAGSPPSGGEFLVRVVRDGKLEATGEVLREWERWCAELLESHISFPVLTYYRSQHANQSWLAALAMMLDSCALLLSMLPPDQTHQAQLTFAMARHAAVDIGLIFGIGPCPVEADRFPPQAKSRLVELLEGSAAQVKNPMDSDAHLTEIRGMYEPFLQALASRFLLTLPPVFILARAADNWQRSPSMPQTPGIGNLPAGRADGEHFT